MTARSRAVPRQRPLWLVIVVPFALLIVITMGLTAWVSMIHGRSAVNQLAVELNQRISAGITAHMRSFADTSFLFLQLVAAPYKTSATEPPDLRTLERSFLRQLRLSRGIDSLYYGNEAGNFVLVKSGKEELSYVRTDNTAPFRHFYRLDEAGNRTELVGTQEYDPRVRPWYKKAVEANRSAWSPIYLFAASPVLGVTPVVPIYDRDGKLRGVFGADLTLTGIAKFLQGLKISPRGAAFIMERSGAIVASSSSEPPFVGSGSERERLRATESTVPIIRSTARAIADEFPDLGQIDGDIQRTYDIGGESRFVQVTVLRDGNGLDWLMTVVIPESDFMAPIDANLRFSMLFSLATLFVAIAIGVFIARRIGKPILRVTDASKALASGELGHQVEVATVEEVRVLGEAFNQMAGRIKDSFRELEEANQELEDRVQQRTDRLAEQMEREHELEEELGAANQKLKELATMDGLTQIANRIRFDAHLQREWVRLAREEEVLALVFCDIDYFKEFNDLYGHLAGDECLQQVANAIKTAVRRPSDLVARYGGEEFVVILPGTDLEGALGIAESIKANVGRLEMRHSGTELAEGCVSLSIGVAAAVPTPDSSPTSLLEKSDAALYDAKKLGRNRIACYSERSPPAG